MDAFSLIQNFFTKMHCNFCAEAFAPEDIQLIREDEGIYIVNVYCNQCSTQNGVAMVGVEVAGDGEETIYDDPELTAEELERLGSYAPISADDVIDAHHFFENLGDDWLKFIPEEMRQLETEPETESEDE